MFTVNIVNAFTKNNSGGNSAGVIILKEKISKSKKQNIAKQVGLSETAFIEKSDKADFKISFFTPNGEVDLCGHATIASFCFMFNSKIIIPGKYTQETKAGILNIEINKNGLCFMNQKLPKFFEIIEPNEILESLNIPQEFLDTDTPIQIVSTGLRDILIPIKSLEILNKIKPNFEKIKSISKTYDVIGYHLFSIEKINDSSLAHCRNFAPLYGIPEESATGTSNGALSSYLWKYLKIENTSFKNLIFEQGYIMNTPSEIYVNLSSNKTNITEIKVGGYANKIKEIYIK